MTQNIFVLGLDDLGREELAAVPNAEQYVFHGLLSIDKLQNGTISLPDLLHRAQHQLDAFNGSIDAIVGYWDFPVSMLLPILCGRYELRSKDLEAVVKCEHKYWSRLVQQQVINEYPGFDIIDIHDPAATLPGHMTYPAWLKPIKSFSSEGAHRVGDDKELQQAMAEERDAPERVGSAFDEVLAMLDLPADIAAIAGGAYMVEEAAAGRQCTVEGYSFGDQIEFIGIVDSFDYENSSSFLRYQYPSLLPEHVQAQIYDVTRRVISAVKLTDSTFNVEYFWDETNDKLMLLEINSRHSQSHAKLFHQVDGVPNHAVMLDLALGREPHMPSREGAYEMAAKWYLRRFADGKVHRVPTDQQIQAIEQRYPGTTINIAAQEGTLLSAADSEDNYSFTLAEIFTAGTGADDVQNIYERCRDALEFEISDIAEGA